MQKSKGWLPWNNTALWPMVLQLHSYSPTEEFRGHPQALAGGTSIFKATRTSGIFVPHRRRRSVGFQIFRSQDREIALKLKYHRLKPGGVPLNFGVGE
jgi:hypothetical protein